MKPRSFSSQWSRAFLKHTELAAFLQRSQSYISDVERGARRLDLLQLREYCQACNQDLVGFVRRFEKAIASKPSLKGRASRWKVAAQESECPPASCRSSSRFFKPIKALIEEEPSFGYRTVAGLLGMNKNTVQRVFPLMGWQVRRRAVVMQPRIQALPSVAQAPNERWATDLCRVWGGRDGWLSLALVIDCYTRQLLGWHLSRTGKASTAAAALEQALIVRFGTLGRVPAPFLLQSDNGLVITSRHYTRLVRSYRLQQEFITPHCPQQNGMVERVIRTLKEQCIHRHRFESQQHATRVIGDWIQFYHQALGIKTPAEAYALAA